MIDPPKLEGLLRDDQVEAYGNQFLEMLKGGLVIDKRMRKEHVAEVEKVAYHEARYHGKQRRWDNPTNWEDIVYYPYYNEDDPEDPETLDGFFMGQR